MEDCAPYTAFWYINTTQKDVFGVDNAPFLTKTLGILRDGNFIEPDEQKRIDTRLEGFDFQNQEEKPDGKT